MGMRGNAAFDHGVARAHYQLSDVTKQLTAYVEDVVRLAVGCFAVAMRPCVFQSRAPRTKQTGGGAGKGLG